MNYGVKQEKGSAKQHIPEFLKDEAIYKHNLTYEDVRHANRAYEPKPFDINEEW